MFRHRTIGLLVVSFKNLKYSKGSFSKEFCRGEDYLRPYCSIKILPNEVLELQPENMYNSRKCSGNVRKR
ncbi:hypothetical protein Desmer_0050 [Desulfosporosinus meridiei DSM 13257]|uniref:Uncharacterized protein n=1 Tax=Desulfosporosinus meridiei (strain ATCC BAA-275 / DSM 13257 / KCTC 12902 / NCIMB 13706 / S10) TaxID=768704 RepID=J7IPR1_DESMD|nr:hypothetical protein Desmer_0050 [Desulfosporosinus meridiei DSM 13257]